MRIIFPIVALLTLAACAPQVPDSAAGFGTQAGLGAGSTDGVPDSNARPRGDAPGNIQVVHSELEFATPGTGVPDTQLPPENRAKISDEQNFNAVKSRVSIKQDAERLARMRAEYKIIPPKPLPPRPGSDGPDIAAYALSTTNNVGQQIYKRFSLFGKGYSERACARYASPDLAQEAFLARGGPQRDPLDLDPDGDGFACSWDPTPFRQGIAKARASERTGTAQGLKNGG